MAGDTYFQSSNYALRTKSFNTTYLCTLQYPVLIMFSELIVPTSIGTVPNIMLPELSKTSNPTYGQYYIPDLH